VGAANSRDGRRTKPKVNPLPILDDRPRGPKGLRASMSAGSAESCTRHRPFLQRRECVYFADAGLVHRRDIVKSCGSVLIKRRPFEDDLVRY
jgi:hypothetical protein